MVGSPRSASSRRIAWVTLVTCSYNDNDGRYIVALRKLREGETEEEMRALMEEAR